jgi:hypothetical protein
MGTSASPWIEAHVEMEGKTLSVEAGAHTRSISAQVEPCLTHKSTLHTLNTP